MSPQWPWSSYRLDERLLEPLARAIHRVEVLELMTVAVVDVERVVCLVDLRRNPGTRDVEPQARERPRDQIEQTHAVRALHLDDRVDVGQVVVDRDLRRPFHAGSRAPRPAA